MQHTRRRAGDISRREFVLSGVSALGAPLLAGCGSTPSGPNLSSPRLTARPGTPTATPDMGMRELGIAAGRDGLLYVPPSYAADTPAPLFIGMHGAGGSGADWGTYPPRADARGMVLLFPDSRLFTWDLIVSGFGPDVEFLDRALAYTFERCAIDPARIAFGGFSDGATYGLSLGVSNGDLFTHLVAYSPGYMAASEPIVGRPSVFVSHGTNDPILPVAASRDLIVPALTDAGYDVTYEQFDGGHEVPAEISEMALDWFLGVA